MSRLLSRLQFNSALWRSLPAFAVVWTLVTGVLVLIGWHVDSVRLVQLLPTLPAMQFNTAVCFCLLGLGFGFLLLGYRKLSAVFGVSVIVLGAVVLSQDVVGWNLGVDTLWMKSFLMEGIVHPGRMAPVTAICHISAALALLLLSSRRAGALGGSFLIALCLCSIGISLAFGYISNLPTSFWWGHGNKIAFHSAIGFLVFGAGIAVYAWQKAAQYEHRMFLWAVVAMDAALLLQTIGFWQSLTVLRQADIERVLNQQVEVVKDAISQDLQERARHLGRMAERWKVRGGTPRDEWEHDAAQFVKDLRGSLALEWVNRQTQVEWAVPPSMAERLVGKSYITGRARTNAWDRAFARHAGYTSELTPLFVGGDGFLTIVPVWRQNVPDGAIVAVYRLEDWLSAIFSEKSSFEDYVIAVFSEGKPLCQWPAGAAPENSRWTKVRDLQVDGLRLSVQVWPGASLQRSMSSALPEIVLLVGTAISTLLTWSVSLLRSIRRQSRALTEANARLTEQMRKLRKAEQSVQESTRLRQAILEGASYPIISTDVHGTVTSFNRAAAQALGYSPEEVIGRCNSEIFHDREEFAQFREALRVTAQLQGDGANDATRAVPFSDGPIQREFAFVRKDGSRFPVKVSISALRDETEAVTGYVGIAYDLTQAKLAEEAVHTARKAAERANQAKSLFLANMSHEVRTPLNAIIGINQMLLESKLEAEQRLWARTLQDSAESLLTIVNDILDFSKVEAGQIELEIIDFDLKKTLDQVSHLHGPKASSKGLILQTRIEEGTPQRLRGDPTRLLQVLNNLVSNAIKFTDRGTIDVTAGAAGGEGDEVCIRFEVADQGLGMDEETCSRIFDPFAQADVSTTRRFGGTGLGLSICRLLVERMGGAIQVASEPGKGSRFWFVARFGIVRRAPSPDAETAAEHEGAPVPLEWSRVTVLLADDSATNRLVAKHQLQKLGCRVEVAQNGREALELLAGCHFDVVLMDCQMPEVDGYEATMELRRREGEGRRTPVVAMTANAMPGEREHCLAIGMDHYLSKPFKAHQLEAVLREVLGRNRHAPEASLAGVA